MKIGRLFTVLFGALLVVGCSSAVSSQGNSSSTTRISSVITNSSTQKQSIVVSTNSTNSTTSSSNVISDDKNSVTSSSSQVVSDSTTSSSVVGSTTSSSVVSSTTSSSVVSSTTSSSVVSSSSTQSSSSTIIPVEKLNPEIVFNYEAGKTFYIGGEEKPTATVSEGADYEFRYSSDESGYDSTEFPTVAGTYSLVVTVTENDTYNAGKGWLWFRLVEMPSQEKADPTVEFGFEPGTTYYVDGEDRPSVTVSEGAEYEIRYSSDTTGYDSTEFPTVAGTYSMVVRVNENEEYNSAFVHRWFKLEASQAQAKVDPSVTFSIEAGATLTIGEDAEPTFEVTEGLNYTYQYEKDEKFFSNELPTTPGTYALVVNVEGNETYNSKAFWVVFTLVEPEPIPEVEYWLYVNDEKTIKFEANLEIADYLLSEYSVTADVKVGDILTIKDNEGNLVSVWCENTESTDGFVVTIEGSHTLYYKTYKDTNGTSLYVAQPEKPIDPTLEPVTIYFTNPNHWSSVYAYTWSGSEFPNGDWPGSLISQDPDTGYYYVENVLPGTNIIFNNNGGSQTSDLVVPSTGETVYERAWYVLGEEPAPSQPSETSYYITFTLPNWTPAASNPRLYYWGSETIEGDFFTAGCESNMTSLGDNTYYIEIDATVRIDGMIIIFDQGSDVKQSMDITENLPTTAGNYNIVMSSEWVQNSGGTWCFTASIEEVK